MKSAAVIFSLISLNVTQGTLLGLRRTGVFGDEFCSFKGIPYAAPPTGDQRFKAPLPPTSWEGTRNATEHGNVAPQLNIVTNVFTAGSEDCLFANVYTPDLNPATPLPVLFVIHGGANMWGSGNDDLYGPDYLVSKLVVVTINYRLATLGFLSTETDDAPGNIALKDQLAALKWVNENIKYFGGDPNCITLFGDTAGSSSIAFHLISPKSSGLFKRAIMTSGAPTCDSVISYEPARRAIQLGKSLGCDVSNTTSLLQCLRSVTPAQLINTNASYTAILASEEKTEAPFKMLAFTGPRVESKASDDAFLTIDPLEALECGQVNKADVMFSYNKEEAAVLAPSYESNYMAIYAKYIELFVPHKILNRGLPGSKILELADKIIKYYFGDKSVTPENMANFVNYASNASIVYDMHRFFRRWPKNVGTTYSFVLSANSTRNVYGSQGAAYGIYGPAHFDQVYYIFNAANVALEKDSKEYYLVKNVTAAVTNFASYGNPSPNGSPLADWPQYNTETRAYANFGDTFEVGYGADDADVTFWASIFKEAGMKF